MKKTSEQQTTESLPGDSPHPKNSLPIALIVSLVFLLTAAGIALGVWQSKKMAPAAQRQNESAISKVSWQSPEVPGNYQVRQEATDTVDSSFYSDIAAGCSLTTTLQDRQDKTADDLIAQANEKAKEFGVTVVQQSPQASFIVKDTEGAEQNFDTVASEQNVDIPGISFKKQFALNAHQTFGSYVAGIGWACQADTWEAKKAEMEQFAKQFILKVER